MVIVLYFQIFEQFSKRHTRSERVSACVWVRDWKGIIFKMCACVNFIGAKMPPAMELNVQCLVVPSRFRGKQKQQRKTNKYTQNIANQPVNLLN